MPSPAPPVESIEQPTSNTSFIVHRLVAPGGFSARIRWKDRGAKKRGSDYYYVRVRQHDGHLAWSSPIWVG
jgi:hypothetical protein